MVRPKTTAPSARWLCQRRESDWASRSNPSSWQRLQAAAAGRGAIEHDHLEVSLVATVGHHHGAVVLPVDPRVAEGPAFMAVAPVWGD